MEEGAEHHEEEASQFIPIPEIFYSDLTGKPMINCVSCDKDLLHSNEPYIIEKAFRHYSEYDINNTIFEYIMCMPCAQKVHDSMSKESRQKIEEFFSKMDLLQRGQDLWEQYGNDFDSWTSKCLVNGSDRSEQEEFQLCAQCVGDKLVFSFLPYMLSFKASDEIASLLSQQTLDEYDRFIDDNFGLPPEFKKALKDNPVILV